MATEAPDPRTLASWEEAFQYPIPVIRKLEQQLRTNADDNREKLRSLVGKSYRSLLDTAETIIDMETRMEHVESKLSQVGRSCNSKGLERISRNAVNMDTDTRSHDAERYTFASQLSVLRNAPLVMTRLMKREGSYLLIAKVLVISRLVHKALVQNKHQPPIVDQLWERLLSVRSKLLRRIDKRLSITTGEASTLVESMCAYALATSSTPTDVLNHFHKVRLDRMNSELKQGGNELAKRGICALKLCIQTCLDTQTIFPRRLAEALGKLKAHPLIQDPDVRGLYELNLDVHGRWLDVEVRNYTPWPRHDELQRPEAERILHRWSKDAISTYLKGIKKALEGEERLKEVASLRQELIETWILSGSRMAGVKSANVLDDLRDTMNDKLESIVRSRTHGLQNVVSKLTSCLDSLSFSEDKTNPSLWDASDQASDLSNGAHAFKSTVLNTFQGRDESVIKVTSAFDEWKDSVLEVKGIVRSMKEARWDDTFADDDDEESDDDLGDSKQTLLSDDDPKLLEEVTQEALAEAMQSLGQSFGKIVQTSVNKTAGGSVQRAAFVLRVVREIGDRIPELRLQDKSTALASPFTSHILQPLHALLASSIVEPSIQSYSSLAATSSKKQSFSHTLAEGNPPLPTQPSPSAFRFLRALNKNMASLGSDLWTPECVAVLKSRVGEEVVKVHAQLAETITPALEHDGKEANGDNDDADQGTSGEDDATEAAEPAAPVAEVDAYRLKQLLFDALYIERFTVATDGGKDAMAQLEEKTGLDGAAMIRLRKNAADYAKKTYLLFALLA